MKFINFKHEGIKQLGILADKEIIKLEELCVLLNIETPATMNELIEAFDESVVNALEKQVNVGAFKGIPMDETEILAPIEYPRRNLFCLGKNYVEHAKELEGKTSNFLGVPTKPIYFSKLASPAIGDKSQIQGHIGVSNEVDYEVELAVVIGKEGKDIPAAEVEDYIFGYTIVNDISARNLQKDHIQWYRAKSLDGFCPMGPVIVHKKDMPLPLSLAISSTVNGEIRQNSNTEKMIFDVPYVISELSKGITLKPGDIIITGTPEGVGMGFDPPRYLKGGDVIVCEIQGIGIITNYLK